MPSDDVHPPGPTFGAIFGDARHYRGDCALLRRALRRGWLHAAPQANRDTVLACFERADAVREAAGSVSSEQYVRVAIGTALAAIAWETEVQREQHAVMDWVIEEGPNPERPLP